ncbi:hypothetical protein Tco_1004053 [Tanacetum coccineum]|uniref:Uncharacterized protein n=1 Tax=Tanacetum coccineum TaxID=301880 RepID=A0ABQ5FB24_9ASTR
MSTANQQTLTESGTEGRPLILEKGSYVPWASTNLSQQERHSRLMNEFDQFAAEAGESLTSVYESELHVNASRGKKDARNHDLLVLVVNSYANPLYSHASPSYSCSPQPYYGTHPSSVHDYDDDYQGEIQGDAKEDKLSTTLLAAKDEAEVNLDTEENDFMLMNAYGDDQLEELNPSVNASQIDLRNGLLSKGDHEHRNHKKFKTIKHTFADDQIDFNIIFDDPYVEDNSEQPEHDPNAHDQTYGDIESLIYNVQVEAENQRIMNNELKKQNALIQRELEMCKERV